MQVVRNMAINIDHHHALELKRQHRRLRGLISQLEQVTQTPDIEMTILDLDEIQGQLGNLVKVVLKEQ